MNPHLVRCLPARAGELDLTGNLLVRTASRSFLASPSNARVLGGKVEQGCALLHTATSGARRDNGGMPRRGLDQAHARCLWLAGPPLLRAGSEYPPRCHAPRIPAAACAHPAPAKSGQVRHARAHCAGGHIIERARPHTSNRTLNKSYVYTREYQARPLNNAYISLERRQMCSQFKNNGWWCNM